MKKIALIFLLLATGPWGAAQSLAVTKITAPQSVPFAQPFSAQLLLSHPIGQNIMLDKDALPADFAITHIDMHPVTSEVTQADLTILPFAINKSTFTATFALAANPKVTVPVEIPLTVTPVKLFNDNELKEIRPPHRLFDWVLLLCILLALLILAALITWWVRHMHPQTAQLKAPADNRPPHVIALSQIDKLLDSGLWEDKQYKLFYITLTDILRNYLQRAFGLDVSADTSAELLRHLKTVEQLQNFAQSLRAFLASGDLVKFAKAVPDEKTRNQDITVLREFIQQTAPKPQPQPPKPVEVKL